MLQLGSLVAVVGFFLRELPGWPPPSWIRRVAADPKRGSCCIWSWEPIPIGIVGLAFRHAVEGPLRSLRVIAIALIAVALLMAVADRFAAGKRDLPDVRLRDALLIGAAQALALVPGVSRSGITLVAGMALGLRRDAAARFSFLLSVPAIGAAGVFELPKVLAATDISTAALVAGLVAAAVSGYLSIAWLLRFLADARHHAVRRVPGGARAATPGRAGPGLADAPIEHHTESRHLVGREFRSALPGQ